MMRIVSKVDSLLVRIFNIHPIQAVDVFTPSRVADVNYTSRLDLENQIISELETPGKQLLLFGSSGSGKTTIIRKILNDKKIGYINIHCDTSITFDDIILNTFDRLDKFVICEKTKSVHFTQSISKEYRSIKNELSSTYSKSESVSAVRLLPPRLTPQKLADFIGEANVVLIIEDLHKVQKEHRQRLADLLKTFVDISDNYRVSKVVCIGACDSVKDLLRLDPNLKNRVSETKVRLLKDEEIRNIVRNGFSLLNVKVSSSLEDSLVYYSARLGSAVHQMCLNICRSLDINKRVRKTIYLDEKAFSHAIDGFIKQNEGTLSTIYDAAVSDQLGWYVLKTFTDECHEKLFFNEIVKIVNVEGRNFDKQMIKTKLDELCSQDFGVVYYSPNSKKYSIASPFWKSYLRMQFAYEQKQVYRSNIEKLSQTMNMINSNDISAMVCSVMLELLQKYADEKSKVSER